MIEFVVKDGGDLVAVAAAVVAAAAAVEQPSAVVVALSGDLGAGKTTLVQAIAAQLGVTETVTSPTFVICRHYETTHSVFANLFHMDAYRIDEVADLTPLRFAELVATPASLFCIEWAEKILLALPPSRIDVTATIGSEGEHIFTITPHHGHA